MQVLPQTIKVVDVGFAQWGDEEHDRVEGGHLQGREEEHQLPGEGDHGVPGEGNFPAFFSLWTKRCYK